MIRNWLQKFMTGRYGPDQLNMALLILAVIVGLVASITGLLVVSIIGEVILFFSLFRMLSKNIQSRRRENDRFLRFWSPVKQKCKGKFAQLRAVRHYKFFNCPGCKKTLRVPRKKGKIQITCPRCGERFIKKT